MDLKDRSELESLRRHMEVIGTEEIALQAQVDEALSSLKKAGLDMNALFPKRTLESAARNIVFCDAIEAVVFGKHTSSDHRLQLQDLRKQCLAMGERFQAYLWDNVFQKQHQGWLRRLWSWLTQEYASLEELKKAIRTEYAFQWKDAVKQQRALCSAGVLAIDASKQAYAKQQTLQRRKTADANWNNTAERVIGDLLRQYADESKLPCIINDLAPTSSSYQPQPYQYGQGAATFQNHSWQHDMVYLHYTTTVLERKLDCKVETVSPSDVGALEPSWSSSTQCAIEVSEEVVLLLVQPVGSAPLMLVVAQTGVDAAVYLVPKNRSLKPLTSRECMLSVRRRRLSKANYDPGTRILCLLSREENQAVIYRFDTYFKTLHPAAEPLNFGDHGLHHVWMTLLIPGKKVQTFEFHIRSVIC